MQPRFTADYNPHWSEWTIKDDGAIVLATPMFSKLTNEYMQAVAKALNDAPPRMP